MAYPEWHDPIVAILPYVVFTPGDMMPVMKWIKVKTTREEMLQYYDSSSYPSFKGTKLSYSRMLRPGEDA